METYIKHWSQVYKVKRENSLGIEEEIWETDGENHFVLATLYALLALDKSGGGTDTFDYQKEREKWASDKAPSIEEILAHQNESPDDWQI